MPTDMESIVEADDSGSDGEETGKPRHDAMVNFAKKVCTAWAGLSEERKTFWNAQAAEINKANDVHDPEHCFQ